MRLLRVIMSIIPAVYPGFFTLFTKFEISGCPSIDTDFRMVYNVDVPADAVPAFSSGGVSSLQAGALKSPS